MKVITGCRIRSESLAGITWIHGFYLLLDFSSSKKWIDTNRVRREAIAGCVHACPKTNFIPKQCRYWIQGNMNFMCYHGRHCYTLSDIQDLSLSFLVSEQQCAQLQAMDCEQSKLVISVMFFNFPDSLAAVNAIWPKCSQWDNGEVCWRCPWESICFSFKRNRTDLAFTPFTPQTCLYL